MAIVVEDGNVIANANSYVSVDEFKAWAEPRGITLPADDADIEPWLIKAFDYIELLRDRYKGETTTSGQALAWPRDCVSYEGSVIADNSIPARLKQAQIQLAVYASRGIELSPINEGSNGGASFLIKQKLGPIEREYSEAAFLAAQQLPQFHPVDKLLGAFMRTGWGQLPVSRA